jgi:2-amino-4-hydroxy-6-hydroxymethyldihydropteridine diphosphokinase
MTSARAFIALGSNLGDRSGHLAMARDRIAVLPGTAVLAVSSIEETPPLGGLDQPAYLNQMVVVETMLSPRELLAACHHIEADAGREHRTRWASRTLDLDLVQYGSIVSHQPDLVLPHPGLVDRDFWRRELAELSRLPG